MYRNKVRLLILFLSVIIFKVHADDVPHESDSVIMRYTANEVVVESFKQNNKLYIQPVSATLLSAREIKESNILNIKDITGLIPNLYMPDYGSKMTSPVFIRGIGAAKDAPSVGLYVDGVPYFDRSTFDFNINDVDRIEVLRGPQGTIYGRNTMGGIINVYTKSPFKYKGTNLSLSAGNHNNYQGGLSHYGNIDNKLGYSFSANYIHSGGFFKNVSTNKKADPIDAVSLRGKLSWRIQPRLTAHLILAYEYSDQDGYPYRLYDKESRKMENIDYNSPSFYRRNMSTNGLNIEYVTDNFKLGSQTSFQFFDGKQGLDQDFSPLDNYYVDFYHRQQMYSQEFNIKSIKDSRYEWQFGLFGFYQNYFQTNYTDIRTTGGYAIQNVKNPTGGFAAYHQSTLNDLFVKGLSATIGIRFDWEKTKLTYESLSSSSTSDEDPYIDDISFSQISPKVSLQYFFGKEGIAYLSVSRGYKTGGFNSTAYPKEPKEDWTFEPEHSWSYETGAKSVFFNNLLSLDLSLFYIDWRDQQIFQPKEASTGYKIRNAGKSSSKGLELAMQVNPMKNLNFQLSYGYTNAKYKDYKSGDLVYDRNYLIMVPRHTLNLSGNYTLTLKNFWFEDIIFNAGYTGVGKIYWNDENDVVQPFYSLVNGKVSFARKNFSIDLWTKNIGNTSYISYYFSMTNGTKHLVQKGRPFTCGVNMNLKF
ncbi:outer membrane receptor protein involved in Fe transport [Dysgonomonas hofstadii]|uniref:Outer membrane receptor protein involved in Fe transport n=1 Tax=Dysgonomonas hofstadii TaxID=637886 RepID=A0A840CGZ5_9BACT|nr:TonB-dependent receptor [Dysgonomonas hofstadii]MBB4035210.1 outer membrane receptor protein involved in Fe transport [Dysgonomonas hofstadii]